MDIVLDFANTSDAFPLGHLMDKLRSLGLESIVCNWIENGLMDGTQRGTVSDSYSEWSLVISGLVLGQLLILCIIDTQDGINNTLSIFADDKYVV